MDPCSRRRFFASLAASWAAAAAGCAPGMRPVLNPVAAGGKGETFGFRKWVDPHADPDVVVIGIHGFCGSSVDYTNLGEHLLEHQPRTGLYAYELRGQGSDPIHQRRGDIGSASEWYRDLLEFTRLVRSRHDGAKVVWYGESMGALIAAHAWREAPVADPPCDGLVFSSPIVRFRDDIPAWTPGLVQVAATTMPLARVSLETLTGGQEVRVTQSAVHGEQVKANPYHVDRYTLRLIGTLARLIDGMNGCAPTFRVPVLVLHGGRDYFNNDADLRGFVARMPREATATYRHYPKAYHLLMYDERRVAVFRDVRRWIAKLRSGRLGKSAKNRRDST